MKIPEPQILFSALIITLFFAYLTLSAPTQTGIYWKDNFSDSAGISTISYLNFSTGNLSISNSPWFYPNHEYRKPITISRNIDPWWNSSWLYRTPITISNYATNLTNYQVAVNLTSSRAPSINWTNNGSDTRFVYYNSTSGNYTQLNFWIESWNSTANTSTIWVNVTSLVNNTNTTVYMYYGNPSAASASNGTNTFDFFGDAISKFSFTDPTKWSMNGNKLISSNTAGNTGGLLVGVSKTDFIYETTMYAPSQSSDNYGLDVRYTNYDSNVVNLYFGRTANIMSIWQGGALGTWATDSSSFISSATPYAVKFIISGTNEYGYADANQKTATTLRISGTNAEVGTGVGFRAGSVTGQYFDTLRVRKYASPEPTASLGAEQPYSLSDYQIAINLTTAIYNNTGLVGSWHFSEGTGNRTADSSGYGNDGTMYGGMNTTLDGNLSSGWVSAGKFGNALRFDGVDDGINLPDASVRNMPVGTHEIWFKRNSITATDEALFGRQHNGVGHYLLTMFAPSTADPYSPGSMLIWKVSSTYLSAGLIQDTNWHQLAGVWNTTRINLYLDGVLTDSIAATESVPDTTATSTDIGRWAGDGLSLKTSFNGSIDEVRIYNRSLSATEIAEQYQAGKARLDYQDLRFTWLNSSTTNSFDNRTQVLTSEGWKFFKDLNGNEGIATLKTEDPELEWQKPTDYLSADFSGEMFEIELENGEILSVTPGQRVYGAVLDKDYANPNFSSNFFVFNTSTLLCCLNALSSDQIGQFNFSAKAKYSESSGSGEILEPSLINSFIPDKENTFNCILTAKNSDLRSLSDNLLLSEISSQYLPISNKINSGETGAILSEKNNLCLLPLAISREITTLASTTTNIFYTKPAFLSCSNLPLLIFLPSSTANSSASSSDNLLLDEIVSTNTLLSSADLLSSNSNALNSIAFRAILDQSSGNSLISCSNSSGISTTNSAIPITNNNINPEHLNPNNFSLMGISEIYGNLEGRELYFLDEDMNLAKIEKIEYQDCMFKIYLNPSFSNTPFVFSTSINPVLFMDSLSSLSFDQTGTPYAFANAVNGKSSTGDFSSASSSQGSNSTLGMILILSANISKNPSNSSSERCVFISRNSLYLLNSSNNLSGAIRNNLSDSKSPALSPSFIVAENNILESTTSVSANTIYLPLYELASLLFNSLPNLTDSSSVISDSEAKNFRKASLSNLSSTAFLATADQLTSGNLPILSSKSSGMTNSGISTTSDNNTDLDLNNMIFQRKIIASMWQSPMGSDICRRHSLRHTPLVSNNFSLLSISEIYGNLEGKELFFLDENFNPVRVKSIRKIPYSGKVYDVDVPNDVVLVRREITEGTWSGNTNSGTREVEIPFWLESDNQAWVKVPNISVAANTTIYMYYGNPSATYNNSLGGNNTFEFFDDFLGSAMDSSKWTQTNVAGTTTVSGGTATLQGGSGSWNIWRANNVYSSPIIFEYYGKTSETNSVFIGAQEATGVLGNDRLSWWVTGTPTKIYYTVNGASESLASRTSDISSWTRLKVIPKATSVEYYENGSLKYTETGASYVPNEPLGASFGAVYTSTYSYLDWVLVRKYASPEPNTLSVGAEQRKPRSGSIGSVQITPPSNFLQWQNFSADSLLGWQYRKEINISNTAGNLTNYQVNVLLINGTNFNSSKVQTNGSDIRFTAPLSYSGNGKWLYKKEIIINNKANPSAWTNNWTLINLIGVGGNDYNFDFSHSYNNGSDIRFYDSDTKSELNYSIGKWNSTTLLANVSVKIPSIPGNSDKRIWIFYGNPNAASFSGSVDGSYTGLNYSLGSEFSINSSYVEIPYWIESWNSSANSSVWVKAPFLQNGTNTTVYMYYGNPSANSASSGTNTFLKYHGYSNTNFADSIGVTVPFVYQARARHVSGSSYAFGVNPGSSTWEEVNHIAMFSYSTGTAGYAHQRKDGVLSSDAGMGAWGTAWRDLKITATSTNVEYIGSGLVTANLNTNIPTASMGLFMATLNDGSGEQDYSFIRKYASPEPNSTVSTTDTSGDFSAGVSDINYKILRNSEFADWKYRKPITINGSTSNLTDYQIPINLTTAIYNNTGLVGSWHFSEGTGNRTADSSGYGNDGTMYGNMNTTLDGNLSSGRVSAGKFGNAMKFDGVNDYVQNSSTLTGIPTGNSARTIEAWVKINSLASTPELGIVRYGSEATSQLFRMDIRNTGQLSFSGYADDLYGVTTLSTGNWYHFAITYNTTHIVLYLNGVYDNSAAKTLNTVIDSDGIRIGSRVGTGYFNGTIDEVRIYNRSLSATEIAEQYRAGKARLDYQDLRFTWLNSTSSAEQNISHWLENDNQAWVKVPNVTASSVANTTLYMYYGNPSATYNNSLGGNNTFLFFDDFNRVDGAPGNGWTCIEGQCGISTNVLRMGVSGVDGWAANPDSGALNGITITGDFRRIDASHGYFAAFVRATSSSSQQWNTDGYGFYCTPTDCAIYDNGNMRNTIAFTSTLNVWYSVEMKINSSDSMEYIIWQRGTAKPTSPMMTWAGPSTSTGTNLKLSSGGDSADQSEADNYYVRKYASPEPSMLSVGAEQNNTLCSGITAEQAKAGYSIAGCAGNITPISLFGVLETQDSRLKTPGLRQWNVTWSVVPTPPQIVLNTPLNNSINTTRNINFTFTPTDSDGFSSCELYTNVTETFASTETKTSITSGALNGINWTFSQDGKFLWNIRCTDTISSSNFSAENRTLILDTTAPNITWNLPANDNSSIVGSWFVQNITVQDANLADLNCTITNASANILWNTWWNLTGLTTFTVSNWTNLAGWNTGPYNETCIARDLTFFFGS